VNAFPDPHERYPKRKGMPGWVLIDSHEDKDDTTKIDWNPSWSKTYNLLKAIVQMQDQSGSANDIRIQFQGDDTANYNRGLIRMDGTTGSGTGETEGWAVLCEADRASMGTILIRGGDMAVNPANQYPMSIAKCSKSYEYAFFTQATLLKDYPDITQLRFFSYDVATGRIALYGYDFPV